MEKKLNDIQKREEKAYSNLPELKHEEELPNTQSDEEVKYIAEMIRERLDAKKKANSYLKKFKIR